MDQRKVKIIKIIAFSAFLLEIIYNQFFYRLLNQYLFHNELDHLLSYTVIPGNIFGAVTWGCLAFLAPNKPVRIMSCMMALHPLLFFLSIIIPYPYTLFGEAFLNFLAIFFLSGIFSNIPFSKDERKWIMMLFLSDIIIVIDRIMLFFCDPSVWKIDFNGDGRLMNEWSACQFYTSDSYALYGWVLRLFIVIGMYKMCFSKAFSGSYDKSAKGTYSPVNKYVIGALVTTIITCGLLCLTLIFRNDIMNLL